ncbi:MAG: hypothetical protein JJT96_08660 [Opitutales bacterium]|nr:hypothetical protein [Opitutales bacterium]
MNTPPDHLEEELRRLRPQDLPVPLRARLGHARRTGLAEVSARQMARRRYTLTALAALMTLGVGSWWLLQSAPEPTAAPPSPAMIADRQEDPASFGMRAVRMEQHLANRIDDGVFIMGDRIGVQQFRYQFVDTVIWEDPRDGSTIEMSVPREEIVLVPLAAF